VAEGGHLTRQPAQGQALQALGDQAGVRSRASDSPEALDTVDDLMHGKISRRWARNCIAEARRVPVSAVAEP
jgi:hypothetical protein